MSDSIIPTKEQFDNLAYPSDVDDSTFRELCACVSPEMMAMAEPIRSAQAGLFRLHFAFSQATCRAIEAAQTIEEVNLIESAIAKLVELVWIDDPIALQGADYAHYRADIRRIDLLATSPYNEYLKSEHWQEVRAGALERAGNRCQLCNRAARLHVHHRTYERRGCELPDDVIVLCADCHKLFHDNRRVAR